MPIDLDSLSDSALIYARDIAKRLNAMVSCIYVIETRNVSGKKNEARNAIQAQNIRRDAEYRLSKRVNHILNGAKTPFELIITSGKVRDKILEKAVDLNVQLIIMSRSNPGGGEKKRIGSITKHIVLKSLVPAIIVGKYETGNREHIIVPLDVFKPFGSQLTCAIYTALSLGATVTVISVIEKGMLDLQSDYLKKLKDIRLLIKDLHIDCNTQLLIARDSVPEEILSFSRKLDSAMILLMTANEMKSKGTSIGSVAREIIARSELPIQCINQNYKSGKHLEMARNGHKTDSLYLFSLKDHFSSTQEELET